MTDAEKIDRAIQEIRAEKARRPDRGSDWYERARPAGQDRISDTGGRGWSGGSWRGDNWSGSRER